MATVISFFYNDECVLPLWLRHHSIFFDHGIMIDLGSSDSSTELIRQITPDWEIKKCSSEVLDQYTFDLEIMGIEWNTPGWKLVLQISEFLLTHYDLNSLGDFYTNEYGVCGVSCHGMTLLDHEPSRPINENVSLFAQKYLALDVNSLGAKLREALGLPLSPTNNRYFHRHTTGLYMPGRASTYHKNCWSATGQLSKEIFILDAEWLKSSLSRSKASNSIRGSNDISQFADGRLKFGENIHHKLSRSRTLHGQNLKSAKWSEIQAEKVVENQWQFS